MGNEDLLFYVSNQLNDLREDYEQGRRQFSVDKFSKQIKEIQAPIDEECGKIMQARFVRHIAKEGKNAV